MTTNPFKNYNFPEELENASAVDQAEYIVRMGEDEYNWGVISEAREYLKDRNNPDKVDRRKPEALPECVMKFLRF